MITMLSPFSCEVASPCWCNQILHALYVCSHTFAQSTQADSIMWLLIVVGGIFLKCQSSHCVKSSVYLFNKPSHFQPTVIPVAMGIIPSRKMSCYLNQVAKRPGLHCFSASRLLCLLWFSNGALCVDSSPSLRSRKADLGLDHNHLGGQEQKLEEERQSLELLRQEMESGFTDLASKLSALTSIGSSDSHSSESGSMAINHVSHSHYDL